jgi:hypothetical protein
VKVETQVENWAGGADGMGRLELRSVAINGNGREKALTVAKALAGGQKARKSRNFDIARWREYTIASGFSRCRFMRKGHGKGKIRANTLDTASPVLVDFPFFQANAVRKQHE